MLENTEYANKGKRVKLNKKRKKQANCQTWQNYAKSAKYNMIGKIFIIGQNGQNQAK